MPGLWRLRRTGATRAGHYPVAVATRPPLHQDRPGSAAGFCGCGVNPGPIFPISVYGGACHSVAPSSRRMKCQPAFGRGVCPWQGVRACVKSLVLRGVQGGAENHSRRAAAGRVDSTVCHVPGAGDGVRVGLPGGGRMADVNKRRGNRISVDREPLPRADRRCLKGTEPRMARARLTVPSAWVLTSCAIGRALAVFVVGQAIRAPPAGVSGQCQPETIARPCSPGRVVPVLVNEVPAQCRPAQCRPGQEGKEADESTVARRWLAHGLSVACQRGDHTRLPWQVCRTVARQVPRQP
jgi:hypothetical protein